MVEEHIDPNTVYISFTGKDKQVALEFAGMLKKHNIPHKISGNEDFEKISDFEKEIGKGKIVVIFYSTAYFKSYHCMNEYALIRKTEDEKRIYTYKCVDFKFDESTIEELEQHWSWEERKVRKAAKANGPDSLTEVQKAACDHEFYIEEDELKTEKRAISIFLLGKFFRDNPYKNGLETLCECVVNHYKEVSAPQQSAVSGSNGLAPTPDKNDFDYNFDAKLYSDDPDAPKLYGREERANMLHKKFFDYGRVCVNVVAMGGQGKTMFAHRYKEMFKNDYGYIHHFSIYHGLDDGFVLGFNNVFLKKDFWEQLNQLNEIGRRDSIIDTLKRIPLKDGKPNLLVIDINIHQVNDNVQKDAKVEEVFDPQFMDVFKKLEGKWHVLLLSRFPFKKLFDKTRLDEDDDKVEDVAPKQTEVWKLPSFVHEKDAVKMFRDISKISENECSNDDIVNVLKFIHYHPLLITTLAAYCGRNNIKEYDEIIGSLGLSLNDKVPSEELLRPGNYDFDVYSYLNKLIDFKEFANPRCQELLRHFILWPYDYVPVKVVDTLLEYYNGGKSYEDYLNILVNDMVLTSSKEENRVYGYTIPQYCEFQVRNYGREEFKGCTKENVKEYEQKLRDAGFPVTQLRGYQLHGMLANTLRQKALIDNYDYSKYSDRVRDLLINPKKTEVLRNCFTYLYNFLYDNFKDLDGSITLTDEMKHFVKKVSNPKDDLQLFAVAHFFLYADYHRDEVYNKAKYTLSKFVVNDNEDCSYLNSLADSLHDFARILNDKSEKTLAELALEKAKEVREVVCKKFNTCETKKYLALEYYTLSVLSKDNPEKCCYYCRQGLSVLDEYDNDSRVLKYQMNRVLCEETECKRLLTLIERDDKCKTIPYMIAVSCGEFNMGCEDKESDKNESPVHAVKLSDYKIGKYPVTQFQWDFVMGDDIPSVLRCDIHRGLGADFPMYNITWYEAEEYCEKLREKGLGNYQLPTEAQWEYAARDGRQDETCKYSGSADIGSVAWYYENSDGTTHRVGEKRSANKLGICDMSGNVWDWCRDWYDAGFYQECKDNPDLYVDPYNSDEPKVKPARVVRGGCWRSYEQRCRVSLRYSRRPEHHTNGLGFRLSLSLRTEQENKNVGSTN